MGDLVPFRGRETMRLVSNQVSGGMTPGSVTHLITRTLPLDTTSIRNSENGIASFLSNLLEIKYLNVGIDAEEITLKSTLYVFVTPSETWGISLEEFIQAMTEKPETLDHEGLKKYIDGLMKRVNVEVSYDVYSPRNTQPLDCTLTESSFPLLLKAAVVGEENGIPYHFQVRTDNSPEALVVYPETFRDPKSIPLYSLVIEYLLKSFSDSLFIYQDGTPVEIVQQSNGKMYIFSIPYGILKSLALDFVRSQSPTNGDSVNPKKLLKLFHRTNILSKLR